MSDQIEIKIDGDKITPEKFIEAAEQFFALVQGVAHNITRLPINWNVSVDTGSAIIRAAVDNPSDESRLAVKTVCQGVRALRNGTRMIPHGFTKKEVNAARILARLNDGTNVRAVLIRNGGSPEDLPASLVRFADAILEGQATDEFGSIEGKIVTMSIKHAYSCTVYDNVHRREIVCYLPDKKVQDEALKGFSKRVLVGGLVHYAKEGYPVNITADMIRIFPPDDELPTLEEIQEIYKLYK